MPIQKKMQLSYYDRDFFSIMTTRTKKKCKSQLRVLKIRNISIYLNCKFIVIKCYFSIDGYLKKFLVEIRSVVSRFNR